MKTNWMGRVRNAVLMALAWAVVWAPVAVLIGLIVDPDGSMDEMWVAIGAYPGFASAIVFSVILGIAGGRGLDSLALPRVAAWGAVAGLIVGIFPFTIGEPTSVVPLWLLGGLVVGTITLLSAVSAVASALVVRRASRWHSVDPLTHA